MVILEFPKILRNVVIEKIATQINLVSFSQRFFSSVYFPHAK